MGSQLGLGSDSGDPAVVADVDRAASDQPTVAFARQDIVCAQSNRRGWGHPTVCRGFPPRCWDGRLSDVHVHAAEPRRILAGEARGNEHLRAGLVEETGDEDGVVERYDLLDVELGELGL